MIYLQLSTGQAPAECQYFARFALRQMLREAEAAGLDAEILSETPSKHGLMSAVVAVSGSLQDNFAQRWLGTLQWVCASPFRPNHARKNWFVAVSRLPDLPALPEEGEVRFETCRAGGKGGQHVNKRKRGARRAHGHRHIRARGKRAQPACQQKTCAGTFGGETRRAACGTNGQTRGRRTRTALPTGTRQRGTRVSR